ncbi:MAG: hypothetical protein DBY32_04970 [Phascolarctobacterium sp.]|nr:MAG: hypothetical protein DBY32_04970 [Phascolarctobacterium sp.]
MKTHYFQRYHSKENVVTANAMLLLSRLYLNSPNSFFTFLNNIVEDIDLDVELKVILQEKNENSVPDAAIMQESFKIAVETKLYNNFSEEQLLHHLESLKWYNYKFLLTLDPREMKDDFKNKIDEKCKEQNVIHIHLTFKKLIEAVKDVVDKRDIDMQNIINDYEQYCYESDLIPNEWKMRLVLSGGTFEKNMEYGIYYHNQDRGYSEHKYIGLYKGKAVKAIGKVKNIVDACVITKNNITNFKAVKGAIDKEIEEKIIKAISEGPNEFDNENLRFFIVDKFYETEFKKTTPYAPMGSRMFDLLEVINDSLPDGSKLDKLPDDTSKIAALLKNCSWK